MLGQLDVVHRVLVQARRLTSQFLQSLQEPVCLLMLQCAPHALSADIVDKGAFALLTKLKSQRNLLLRTIGRMLGAGLFESDLLAHQTSCPRLSGSFWSGTAAPVLQVHTSITDTFSESGLSVPSGQTSLINKLRR